MWLLSKQREREANQVLRDAAALNDFTMPDFTIVGDYEGVGEGSLGDLVGTKAARSTTLPIWAIWGLFGFTYYGLVIFEGRMFSNQDEVAVGDAKDSCRFDYPSIFYNAASEFFAVILSAALINRIGRVYSQSLFYAIGGVAMVVMGHNFSPSVVLFFSIVARMCAMSGSVRTLL